ncbi:MAG: transfer agent orfg15, like protein [Caulobacter sp.]|nr:transfer agent orfg15, like protein [Caulobacter sp.]
MRAVPGALTDALVRAEVSDLERGLAMTWRAAPAGGPPAGESMTETVAVWRGLALRPWSPVHLKTRMIGADAHLAWIRRARLHGDGWESEIPLGEEREVYRVEVLDGETAVRTVEVGAPAFVYTAAMRAADFPGGPGGAARVRVAQGSAIQGWGASVDALL